MSEVLAVLVNVVMYFLVFRVLTPKAVNRRKLLPGAVVGGVAWTILQAVGGYLIGHDLRHDSVTYGVFGIVLGLLAWIYVGSEITIYAAEFNTVLARHLWPRGMVQPPLTEADQRSMALQATQNQRRPEQEVSVGFNTPAMSQREWLSSRANEPDDNETGDKVELDQSNKQEAAGERENRGRVRSVGECTAGAASRSREGHGCVGRQHGVAFRILNRGTHEAMRTPGFASEPLPAPKVGDLHQKRVRGFPALGRRHKKSQLSAVVLSATLIEHDQGICRRRT